MFDFESHRVKSGWHFVEQTADFGTSIGVCRQFIGSESSPPADEFEKLQQSYNAQCEWFKNASSVLRSLQDGGTTAIDAVVLFGPVPEGGDRQIYQSFLNAITNYNSTLAGAQALKQQATRSSFEEVVRLLGPALIALALALRMTKVTVEIKNEQKKN
jgi:hypothetical protein